MGKVCRKLGSALTDSVTFMSSFFVTDLMRSTFTWQRLTDDAQPGQYGMEPTFAYPVKLQRN
jgi:hypothetical protein